MRTIKYRGLSKNGWVYGLPFYSQGTSEWKIVKSNGWTPKYNNPDEGESNEFINVDAETIGQFTGLHDKNGKEIYEGDIVEYNQEYIGEIQYWVGQICVGYRYKSNNVTFPLKIGNAISMEVIGNIHENPELL